MHNSNSSNINTTENIEKVILNLNNIFVVAIYSIFLIKNRNQHHQKSNLHYRI